MKRVKVAVMLAALPILALFLTACATTTAEHKVQVPNAPVATTGEPVYLSFQGSPWPKEGICPNAVWPVYRYDGRYSSIGSTGVIRNEVGKIRIAKQMNENYMQAVVVDGNIQDGDTAVPPHKECSEETK